MKATNSINNIDDYIKTFPEEIAVILGKVRETIRKAAPTASEKLSYAIPTFVTSRNLVHFAAHKAHIGFYPGPDAIEYFEAELTKYKLSKGAVQFPLNRPIPYGLITKITKYRVKQELERLKG